MLRKPVEYHCSHCGVNITEQMWFVDVFYYLCVSCGERRHLTIQQPQDDDETEDEMDTNLVVATNNNNSNDPDATEDEFDPAVGGDQH